MTYELIPVLAISGTDIVFWVIVVGSIVGSLISKHMKERKEQAGDGPSTVGGTSRQERLQELAARRREQLRQLSEQQGTQPTNLTSSQHADRRQARSVYDRRAEALRRAQAQKAQGGPAMALPVDQTRARAQAQAQARAQAEKRAAEAQVAAHAEETERRQRAEQLKRQQRLDAIAQRERAGQAARQDARSKRDADLGAGARGKTRSRTDSGAVARRVTDADSSAYDTDRRVESRFKAALKGSSLRDAIIFKEILDQPRAMRPLEDLF